VFKKDTFYCKFAGNQSYSFTGVAGARFWEDTWRMTAARKGWVAMSSDRGMNRPFLKRNHETHETHEMCVFFVYFVGTSLYHDRALGLRSALLFGMSRVA
jgi:hypothetical protein